MLLHSLFCKNASMSSSHKGGISRREFLELLGLFAGYGGLQIFMVKVKRGVGRYLGYMRTMYEIVRANMVLRVYIFEGQVRRE